MQPPPVVWVSQPIPPVMVVAVDGNGDPIPNLPIAIHSISHLVNGFYPFITPLITGVYNNYAVGAPVWFIVFCFRMFIIVLFPTACVHRFSPCNGCLMWRRAVQRTRGAITLL